MKTKNILLFLITVFTAITVHSQVSFTADVSGGCIPLNVNFTNTSTLPAGTYYQWNFGTGPSSSSFNATYTYEWTGNFNVQLQAYDTTGGGMIFLGSYNLPGGINVSGSPLYYTSDTVCPNESIEMYLYPYGNNTSWDFGDGNTSTQNQPSHTYTAPGNYVVTVTSNTSCGFQTIIHTFVVMNNAQPNASFNSVGTICPGDIAQFWPQNYNADSYSWDFGDGNISSDKQPEHSWATIGNYTVTLILTSQCGTTDTATNVVQVQNGLHIGNWIQIFASGSTVCPGDVIDFDFNMNGMPTILWDFGDGNTSTDKNTSHAYASPGNYTVELYLVNGCGNDTTIYYNVTVSNSIPFGGNPQMIFNPNPVCPGDDVQFYSSSAFSYAWDFGDGNTSTDPQPVHSYAGTGDYVVELTLTNGCGNSAVITDTLYVNNSVIPTLYSSGNNSNWGLPNMDFCPGDTSVFFAMGGASYLWDFGDGNTTTQTTPVTITDGNNSFVVDIASYAYANPGTYTVTLTLTNSCGNSATDSLVLTVGGNQPAEAEFVMTTPDPMACSEINFLTFGGTEYIWNFGDGNSDTTSSGNISHVYAQPGVYAVSLTTINGCGNSASVSENITIGGMTATASNVTDAICYNSATGSAEINTDGGNSPYTYSINGGNAQPTNLFSGLMPGTHNIEITDNNGCVFNFPLIISSPPAISINISTVNSTCGNADGSATANVTGGTGAYTYFWSTGGNGASENNLAAGSYTLSVTDINTCFMTETFSVNDNGGPVVLLDTVFSTMCMEESAFEITGGTPSGGIYSGNGVNSGYFDPANAGAGTHTIIYTYTQAGCTSSSSQTITVFETPVVNYTTTLEDICIDGVPLNLTGGFPSGGIYSGTGVSGGSFNPATAGSGLHGITYSYTDANNCSNSASNSIEVIDVDFSNSFSPMCIDASPLALSGGSPAGGMYSGPGVTAGSFDPALAGSGNAIITYTFTSGNCTMSETQTILVNDLPTVTFDTIIPLTCVYAGDITLTGAVPSGGTFTGTGIAGNTFSPSGAGVGTHEIVYTYNDGNCENSDTISITVDACLGIVNNQNDFSVNIYPNPFVTNTTITLSDVDENFILYITDLSGKTIREITLTNTSTLLERGNMSTGLYFYTVRSNKGILTTGKIILE